MSSRRLHEDKYVHLGHTSSRPLQNVLPRRLHDILKMSSRSLAKTSSRHLQDILKASSRHFEGVFKILQDIFKTSCQNFLSNHLQDTFKTSSSLQDVFKAYRQVKLSLLTRLQDAFKKHSTRF